MRKYLYLALIILISSFTLQAQQDQIVNGRNTNLTIAKNVPWINLASQTYIMAPLGPDYGFCVSMINNNPTSSHTFTVATFQTGDNDVSDFTHNTGRFASLTVVGNPSPIAASTTQTFFVRSNGASKIAFQFAGGITQAGSPDTVDIFAVQTTAAGCGTVNPQTGQAYTLATPGTGTSSASPIMAVSDGLGAAFALPFSVVNPANNAYINSLEGSNLTNNKTLYLDKIIVSTTSAAPIQINFYEYNSLLATGCGVGGPLAGNLKVSGGIASVSQGISGCTSNPTALPLTAFPFFVNANSYIVLDLKGYIIPPSAGNQGIWLVNVGGAVTGTVSTTFFWYEK